MMEVANLLPADHKVAVIRHYEVEPPADLELVEPGETFATTKEEEWVSKKKTEVTNTKQIETRVKRQVVLEDGKVVEDSGPLVTTNTTEDSETQEHHQTELRKLGGDDVDGEQQPAIEGSPPVLDDDSKWVAVSNPDGVVREVKERKVISREETEELKETEDVQHLGDITDEKFLAAVNTGKKDLRDALRSSEAGQTVVSTGPRIVHESTRTTKVTDTEDTKQLSSVRPDGRIVTETERTTQHEELKDDELPKDAPDLNTHLENSQRYFKTREQEDVDYIADGVKIGHEMRYKAETMEVERRGDGIDEPDWDSLSARAKRRANFRQPHRYRDALPTESQMDRKDALTKKPLDFDQEEETRKVETSKWLENHFGSESRSSKDSVDDEDEKPPKTSFFNVTIKSQPSRPEPVPTYISNVTTVPRTYAQQEPDRERDKISSGYFQGITDWSERRKEHYSADKRHSPVSPMRGRVSPLGSREYQRSPVPDYRQSPIFEQGVSPVKDATPTPPQRKKAMERRQRISQDSRYDSGYRTPSRNETRDSRDEPLEEPPPDYSPPNAPSVPLEKKQQKTRFAVDPPKHKSGNIIGQSIRKLVGKIRSASAERKARQRAKRSPSPSYLKGHDIDSNINHDAMNSRPRRTSSPVHRYYLGEDPFGGSIYGRENKYDGVRPVRSSRKQQDENRSQSTLGRFSKSTGRLPSSSAQDSRVSQTLPRHVTAKNPVPATLQRNDKSSSTINVSIINTVSQQRHIVNGGPAKPARTYKSNLSRSQSFNVQAGDLNGRRTMYKSNPQLNRLDQVPAGLKSPALISSINRSHQNLTENVEETYTSRFGKNGYSDAADNKKVFLKGLKDRAPELFRTLHEGEDESWRKPPAAYTAPVNIRNNFNGDIYEPPTRLRDTASPITTRNVVRRGSSSSNDYSETYRTTSRNDDPLRPSITNTVQSFSKKTIPGKNGRSMETIESTETKSVTKSRYRGEPASHTKFYENDRMLGTSSSPVVIEVRSNYRK